MIKIIREIYKTYSKQRKIERRIDILLTKKDKDDYVKIRIPRKYVGMLELIIMYGISTRAELYKILSKNINNN